MFQYLTGTGELSSDVFCLPNGATYDQLRLVVAAYMKDFPQHLHQQFSFIVTAALVRAFPCANSTTAEKTKKP